MSPTTAKYSRYTSLNKILLGYSEESHTGEQMPQISAAKMGRARRSKIASKNSKNTGLSNGEVFGRERERGGRWVSEWRARWAPHHATARPKACRATTWCGGMVGPPGQLQALPHSTLKNRTNGIIFTDF